MCDVMAQAGPGVHPPPASPGPTAGGIFGLLLDANTMVQQELFKKISKETIFWGLAAETRAQWSLLQLFLKILARPREGSPAIMESQGRLGNAALATVVWRAPNQPTGLGQRKVSGVYDGEGEIEMLGCPEAAGQLLSPCENCHVAQIPHSCTCLPLVPLQKIKIPSAVLLDRVANTFFPLPHRLRKSVWACLQGEVLLRAPVVQTLQRAPLHDIYFSN